ncbi:TetR/AcrR family transcriptional regulator [Nocardioides sp. NPDC126508]
MDPARSHERVPIRRPGGRAASVVARVHQAARELLTEVGYEAVQLPDVAARAGVNKTTVYRRWPTKSDLVADLLLGLSDHDLPRADTGSLLGDLVAMLKDVAELLRTPLMQAMVRASLDGSIDQEARLSFWAERMHRSSVIIERAVRRGELPESADARSILEHAASPIYFRLLVTGEPVTDHDIGRFAERAIEAAQRA